MPNISINEALKYKEYKYGTIYISDLFNSMYLIVLEIPNYPEDLSKTFFYSDKTQKQQRSAANKFYNKVRELLAKGDYKSIEEIMT